MMISLNGLWDVRLPDGQTARISVPGCIEQVTDTWDIAQSVTYTKSFHIDEQPAYARLCFSGVSYACRVWLNGVYLGDHEGIWDRFTMDTDAALRLGDNQLTVETIKPGYSDTDPYPLRQTLCGFIPDVLVAFGGLWDDVTLEMSDDLFIDKTWAVGHEDGGFSAHLLIDCRVPLAAEWRLEVCSDAEIPLAVYTGRTDRAAGLRQVDVEGSLPSCRVWSCSDPYLYTCRWTLTLDGRMKTSECRMGFRSFAAQGSRLTLNSQPFYLRGVLHWGYYDDLIIPNPGKDRALNELSTIQHFGFNTVKHCLYVPREDVLTAADEAGVILWIELPL